ncbi:MAG: hypothetical protein J6K90_01650 [Tidjanibacter sp.]|nr:hypothetical protein [Tidjanibacter sp.]MBR6830464.1 hypothetical protein [Tidjanibacter sp.]
MWRKILKIFLLVLFWGATGYYVWWSIGVGRAATEQIVVNKLDIRVTDSNTINIITANMVRTWLIDGGLNPIGKQVDKVPTAEINKYIKSNPFVGSVKSVVNYNGQMDITLSQRKPVFRVNNAAGYSFYYTDDGHIVPTTHYSAHYLPVVTGDFTLPFDKEFTGELESFIAENKKNSDKNYIFLCKLIKFVRHISNDAFWDSEIVQICVSQSSNGPSDEPEVELIPRIGDNVIMLGTLDDFKDKMERLHSFYINAQSWEGWQTGGYLNLKYDNQIVCTK